MKRHKLPICNDKKNKTVDCKYFEKKNDLKKIEILINILLTQKTLKMSLLSFYFLYSFFFYFVCKCRWNSGYSMRCVFVNSHGDFCLEDQSRHIQLATAFSWLFKMKYNFWPFFECSIESTDGMYGSVSLSASKSGNI